jgi:hypothetical protein
MGRHNLHQNRDRLLQGGVASAFMGHALMIDD